MRMRRNVSSVRPKNGGGDHGRSGGDGNRLCPDHNECCFDMAENLFLATPGPTAEQRARCTRQQRDLNGHDETTGAWAVATPTQELLVIHERVDEIALIRNINITLSAEQLRAQCVLERNTHARLVTQHHEVQTIRLLDDQVVALSNLTMNAQHPESILAAFIRALEARVCAHVQAASPICHDDHGRGSGERKSDDDDEHHKQACCLCPAGVCWTK